MGGRSCDFKVEVGVVHGESLLWEGWGKGTGGTGSDLGGVLRTSKLDEEPERLFRFLSLSRLRRRGIVGMLGRGTIRVVDFDPGRAESNGTLL